MAADSADFSENILSLFSSPIGVVMKDAILLEGDASVQEATKLMGEKKQRCALISHKGEVVGLVSETDILYKVTEEGRNPGKVRLREIMTCPVVAVDPHMTVRAALDLMTRRNVKQVMVHAYSAVLGIVSKEDIYVKMQSISLAKPGKAIAV
jgi:CBS domain-containing protein